MLVVRPLSPAVRAFSTSARVLPLASRENAAGWAKISVAVRAGARVENAPGSAAALKHWLLQGSNIHRSALAGVRESELRGITLSTSLTKDALLLNASFLKQDTSFVVNLLGDALQPTLKPWEFTEHVVPALQAESEALAHSPEVAGIEALSATAYHARGPGQASVAHPASPLSYETVRQFAESSLVQDKLAIAANGIELTKLEDLVQGSFSSLRSGFAVEAQGPTTYFGGDARIPMLTHGNDQFYLAFDAASINPAVLTVLSYLLGNGQGGLFLTVLARPLWLKWVASTLELRQKLFILRLRTQRCLVCTFRLLLRLRARPSSGQSRSSNSSLSRSRRMRSPQPLHRRNLPRRSSTIRRMRPSTLRCVCC